jgi:hypothetical protein
MKDGKRKPPSALPKLIGAAAKRRKDMSSPQLSYPKGNLPHQIDAAVAQTSYYLMEKFTNPRIVVNAEYGCFSSSYLIHSKLSILGTISSTAKKRYPLMLSILFRNFTTRPGRLISSYRL